MQTIGMISSYPDLSPAPWDWLWHQTPQPFGVWNHLQMLAQAPQPDFLLLYNFNQFPQRHRKKLWFREQQAFQQATQAFQQQLRQVEPSRTICLVREPPFPEKQPQRIADYRQAQAVCGYVSGPDDFAPCPDYMPAIWYHTHPFQFLNAAPIPEKHRTCSWITSGIDRTAHHRDRLQFLRRLQESGFEFDLYGRGLPEWTASPGKISQKWHGMAPYYYNLAIENFADNEWYVSEKLWDALLAWCLPIYYGGPAADKLLPPGSFLRLPSLDERGVAYIREVTATAEAWHTAKEAIAEARQIILHELNLLNWLSKFVAQF